MKPLSKSLVSLLFCFVIALVLSCSRVTTTLALDETDPASSPAPSGAADVVTEEGVSAELVEDVSVDEPKEASATTTDNVSIVIGENTITPQELKIVPGTTVVWVNNATSHVQVKFRSKGVSTTCKAPRGFELSKKGIFTSKEMVIGGVASLCFLEPRNYEYEVRYITPQVKLENDEIVLGVVRVN